MHGLLVWRRVHHVASPVHLDVILTGQQEKRSDVYRQYLSVWGVVDDILTYAHRGRSENAKERHSAANQHVHPQRWE